MKPKNLLDRNEVAALIDPKVTAEMVRKNERRWNIAQYRVTLNRRNIFYKRTGIEKAFVALGFLEPK